MIGPLLRAVGLAAITGGARASARKARRRLAIAITTVLLFVSGAGFALAALTGWLAGELGTTGALAVVAGLLVSVALIIRGLSLLTDKRRKQVRPAQLEELAQAFEADGHLGSELVAVAVVALAGFLLARQIGRS